MKVTTDLHPVPKFRMREASRRHNGAVFRQRDKITIIIIIITIIN
jgi:hypothetical protein